MADSGEAEAAEEGAGSDDSTNEGPPTIEETIALARDMVAKGGTMMDAAGSGEESEGEVDGKDAEGEASEEEKEEGEEEGAQEEESGDDEGSADEEAGEEAAGEDDEGGEDDGDGEVGEEEEEEQEKEGDGEEEEEAEEKKPITVKIPSREEGGEDVEIEVDDAETAERLNQMRNGFMRGEAVRKREGELRVVQDQLQGISEQFEIDPAGFVLEYVEEADLPQVALALLVESEVWKKLEPVIDKLFQDPGELRTLQAEAKVSRLQTAAKLKDTLAAREEENKNSQALHNAIDLMVPEGLESGTRQQLIADLTRDVGEHIDRNKLKKLEIKDLPTIVGDRLQLSGIDPLEARKAIQDGTRSRGKLSTKKGLKKKPKSGKELVKASAKRKKVAAAPGPGRKTAPTQPTKLPAGESIEERFATVKKAGGLQKFLQR